jgi:hypothetical protein
MVGCATCDVDEIGNFLAEPVEDEPRLTTDDKNFPSQAPRWLVTPKKWETNMSPEEFKSSIEHPEPPARLSAPLADVSTAIRLNVTDKYGIGRRVWPRATPHPTQR